MRLNKSWEELLDERKKIEQSVSWIVAVAFLLGLVLGVAVGVSWQ